MTSANRTYYISLGYDAYYCKIMAVAADSLSEACRFAMAHADEGAVWEDTLESSPHWIASIDGNSDVVPEEYREMAIRCGRLGPVAYRLHSALSALVRACEQDATRISAIGSEIERAKAALVDFPLGD